MLSNKNTVFITVFFKLKLKLKCKTTNNMGAFYQRTANGNLETFVNHVPAVSSWDFFSFCRYSSVPLMRLKTSSTVNTDHTLAVAITMYCVLPVIRAVDVYGSLTTHLRNGTSPWLPAKVIKYNLLKREKLTLKIPPKLYLHPGD